MKMLAAVTATTIALTGAAFAQAPTTTEAAVLGTSDDPIYSMVVQGTNGVVYKCKPIVVRIDDGLPARPCKGPGAGVLDQGLAGGAAAGLGALALIALAASGSSSTTTTTTTN